MSHICPVVNAIDKRSLLLAQGEKYKGPALEVPQGTACVYLKVTIDMCLMCS